jgi:hypothetical protein
VNTSSSFSFAFAVSSRSTELRWMPQLEVFITSVGNEFREQGVALKLGALCASRHQVGRRTDKYSTVSRSKATVRIGRRPCCHVANGSWLILPEKLISDSEGASILKPRHKV